MNTTLREQCDPHSGAQLGGPNWPSGVARDQFIFGIICTAAVFVAIIVLVTQITPRSSGPKASDWECLDCGNTFNEKAFRIPPTQCPKCGGQAAMLHYTTCRSCKEKAVQSRFRLTEQAQAQYADIKIQVEKQGYTKSGPPVGLPMGMPMESQYRIKKDDGSYGWSEWVPQGGPEALLLLNSMTCPECGARLR